MVTPFEWREIEKHCDDEAKTPLLYKMLLDLNKRVEELEEIHKYYE